MARTFHEIHREIVIARAPSDLEAVIKVIDAAVASLIADGAPSVPVYDLSRVAGRLEAMRLALSSNKEG